MAVSARYKELRSRINELKKHFLPNKFSPTGNYTARQMDRARGYRLLVHAEIESYLEDTVKEIITDCIIVWKKNEKPSSLLIAFLTFYHSAWNDGDDINNQEIIDMARSRKHDKNNGIKPSVEKIIDKAAQQFNKKIKDNHGIREKNFNELILPTGINIDKLNQTWLTDLDNFGSLRGEIAHNAKKVTSEINPKDEYDKVESLLIGLKDLDNLILNKKQELGINHPRKPR